MNQKELVSFPLISTPYHNIITRMYPQGEYSYLYYVVYKLFYLPVLSFPYLTRSNHRTVWNS